MKNVRKALSLLLVLILTAGLLPRPVQATEDTGLTITVHYDNPLYREEPGYSAYDRAQTAEARSALADDAAISDAAGQLRSAITARSEECVVQIQTSGYDEEDFRTMIHEIATQAEAHTGVPNEGDYIAWQYGGWDCSASGSASGSGYSWTITYIYEYYTTAQEEAQVDSQVRTLLNSLNVSAASDYEKVKAIYDYICANVTYDHAHLNDNSYKHQFTAYGALVDGTSVCQGYALLFYRLALELGVDARLIAGTSKGEGHGWNILELGGRYYNADTTWDAGSTNYTYFLKCPANFPDHTRDSVYDTTEFHQAYPMASADYEPGAEAECNHSYTVTDEIEPTCSTEGETVYLCSICGNSYVETSAKLEHNFGEVNWEWDIEDTSATAYKTCETCGYVVSAKSHTFYFDYVPSTCYEDGYKVYEAEATLDGEEVSSGFTEILPAHHRYSENWNWSDDYSSASITLVCSSCDIITEKDATISKNIVDATCTESGSIEYIASTAVDNQEYTDTKTFTIEALGHNDSPEWNWSNDNTSATLSSTCSNCGETFTVTGSITQESIVEATCDQNGSITRTATATLHDIEYTSSKTEVIPATHSWDDGAVTKEPTESEEGIRTYTCEACGETKTESIDKLGSTECTHSYEAVTTEPTCTAEGQTVYTCTGCGYSYTESIAKLDHQWDEGTVTKEPTATEAGEKTQHCATCDNVRITKLPATGKVFRLQGDNRYETAFAVADHLKVATTAEKFYNIVIASGTSFADALAGSYLASQYQAPILLVNQYTVQDVADYVFENAHSDARIFILGGEAAVPATLDALLEDEFDVTRLAGDNRYETNLKILDAAGWDGQSLCICTGREFADALSVSALGIPILLVNKTLNDQQISLLENAQFQNIYIIGGESAVSAALCEAINEATGLNATRISGSNRYETSAKVAETFFPVEANNIVLAYGQNFPDGLCGGVLAYNMAAPLILTRDNTISYAVEFAASRNVTTGVVLGGSGLISDSSVRQIFAMGESDSITLP